MREIFQTERLIIRELSEKDVPDLFEIYSRPEVMTFLQRDPVQSHDEIRERISPIIEMWKDKPHGYWAIWHKEDQRVIGCTMLKPLPNDDRIEVGWHLHYGYWGVGYATEAAKGAINYGFEVIGIEEIFAILLAENQASWRVAVRCGLMHQGQTDRYHDLVLELFRIAVDEWRSQC